MITLQLICTGGHQCREKWITKKLLEKIWLHQYMTENTQVSEFDLGYIQVAHFIIPLNTRIPKQKSQNLF